MIIILTRESYKNHPVIMSIISSIDKEYFAGVFDIRNLLSLMKYIKTKKTTIICTDPLVFLICFVLNPFKKKIFFSLEMYEFQKFNDSIFNIARNFIFKVSHYIALKFSFKVVFSNKARFRFYFFKKWVKLNKVHLVENTPSNEILKVMNEINNSDQTILKSETLKKYKIPIKFLNRKIYVYAGSLSKARGISQLINLFNNNNDSILIIAGSDKQNEFNFINSMNIFYVGKLSKIETLKLVKISDFQIAFYSNKLINTKYCAPVKVYESLYLKTPILINDNIGVKSLSINKYVYIYKKLVPNEIFIKKNTSDKFEDIYIPPMDEMIKHVIRF